MSLSVALCRPVSAVARVIGGEHRLEILDEAGTRMTVLFDTRSAAEYAAAGIKGGMSVDRRAADTR